jgi:hypothetical protein
LTTEAVFILRLQSKMPKHYILCISLNNLPMVGSISCDATFFPIN